MAQHNPGYITASTVSPFLTGKGDTLLKGGETAAVKIAMERSGIVTITNEIWDGNSATEWGNEHEADAILRYEEIEFASVTDQQKGVAEGWLSCTPDGYVNDDGLVEVKCPYNESVHFGYLLDSVALKDKYYDQVQFQLMLTGRKWCDLVSYHPHYNEPNDIVKVRIEPDPDWVKRCRSRIDQAEAIIEQTLSCLS